MMCCFDSPIYKHLPELFEADVFPQRDARQLMKHKEACCGCFAAAAVGVSLSSDGRMRSGGELSANRRHKQAGSGIGSSYDEHSVCPTSQLSYITRYLTSEMEEKTHDRPSGNGSEDSF